MKFGKRLLREQAEEWQAHYVSYKLLKRAIAATHDGDKLLFEQLLRAELDKVSAFYSAECDKLGAALDELERAVRPGGAGPAPRGDGSGASPPVPVTAVLAAAQRTLAAVLVPQLGALRLFVVLNYTAVVKAVKKWNKHGNTGGDAGRLDAVAVLLRAPFFNAAALARAVTRAELLAAALAPAAARCWTDFACPICLDVLRNPVLLSCAHRFCFSCVATAALYSGEAAAARGGSGVAVEPRGLRCDCPVCRKPQVLDEGALQVDPALDDFVRAHFGDALAAAADGGAGGGDAGCGALARAPAGAESYHPPPPSLRSSASAAALAALRDAARVPKLLIIGIDGCRPDALLLADAPAARGLVCGGGAFALHGAVDAHSPDGPPPAPLPGWQTLLTGRADGGAGNAPTLFDLLAAVRPWVRSQLFTSRPQLASRCRGVCAPEPAANDARAATAAAAALAAATAPDVVALQLGEVQATGERYGFGPHVGPYRDAIAAADRRLAALLDVLRRRATSCPSEDWLVVVTSTGGGTTRADMTPALAAATAAAEWRRRGDGAATSTAKPGAAAPPGGPPPASEGAYGTPGLPQHEDSFVLLWGRGVRRGELLPPPRAVDALPSALAHFGVLPRWEWALQGRAWDAVGGAAAWSRAASRVPEPPEDATSAADAAAAELDAAPSALDALTADDVAAAAAAVACCGGLPLAFFASVPGLLDPQPMAVVGHRGAGMNAGTRDGAAVRENTVASFAAAAQAGATWVEMDVQVTADGVPVIWHDDEVLSRQGSSGVSSQALRALTAAQFQALGPAPGAAADIGRAGAACGLLRRFKGACVGDEAPWDCPSEAPLPTLEEALRSAPPELGFNLELKFVESEPLTPDQLTAFLRAVLAVCERAAGSRRVFFSSFDPDAACGMRRLTARWPVLLLTDAAGDPGSAWPRHTDARRNGVRAALSVAVAGGLAGVVTEADALIATPTLAAEVRATGLLLATWGAANTRPEQVRQQAQWGVCALITDSIRTAVSALDDNSGPGKGGPGGGDPGGNAGGGAAAPVRPASAGAAPPAVRAAVAALPPFLGGGGALPESMLRSHPLTEVCFSAHDGDVNCTYAPDGSVSVRQTPMYEDRALGQRVLAAAMAAPAAPGQACSCRPGLICHSCAFAGGRGGAAGGAASGASAWQGSGAAALIAARGAVSPRGPWAHRAEGFSPEVAPRLPGLRLNLGQLLLPSPRLWRAT